MCIENFIIVDNEVVFIGGGIENQNNGDVNVNLYIVFLIIICNIVGILGSVLVE